MRHHPEERDPGRAPRADERARQHEHPREAEQHARERDFDVQFEGECDPDRHAKRGPDLRPDDEPDAAGKFQPEPGSEQRSVAEAHRLELAVKLQPVSVAEPDVAIAVTEPDENLAIAEAEPDENLAIAKAEAQDTAALRPGAVVLGQRAGEARGGRQLRGLGVEH